MSNVPAEVERLIEGERHIAHLGTAVGDDPHVAPLWYRYEDGEIEIATTGRKLENLRTNPKVALSIQSAENGMPEWMVAFQGSAMVVDDEEASHAGKGRIHEKYGIDADAFPENVLVRIDIGTVAYKIF